MADRTVVLTYDAGSLRAATSVAQRALAFMAAYWQATEHLHVRRGSTVRVRQRALQKACTAAAYRAEPLAPSSTCGGYGALYGAFRSKTSSAARAESPLSQLSKAAEKSLISWSPSVPRSACGSSAPILRSVHTSSASEASSRKTAVSVACDVNAGRYGTGRIAGLPGVVACNRS